MVKKSKGKNGWEVVSEKGILGIRSPCGVGFLNSKATLRNPHVQLILRQPSPSHATHLLKVFRQPVELLCCA